MSTLIKVDIEPPEESDDDKLTEDQLAKLGLPSKHIHYTAAAESGNTAELLQPADIQVSYADTADTVSENHDSEHVILWPGSALPRDTVDVPELENEEIDFPRALPDIAVDRQLVDNIYNVDAYCGLSCGGGQCKILQSGLKKCLCPPGWTGPSCDTMIMISGVPRLSGGAECIDGIYGL